MKYEVYNKIKQDIEVMFNEPIELQLDSNSDTLLVESVKEQIKADQLIAKNEFIAKVIYFQYKFAVTLIDLFHFVHY